MNPRGAHGAFVPGPRARAAPIGRGALDGLRLAVKDLIDVEGVVTGGGNPDWAAAHAPAARHAPAVHALLAAGATLVGKTVTDELAFSLEGENAHHGTPRNPRAPDRLPGGSSSGSAVAVAAGEADIALGTDTGGSVRIPASFCSVFGFRPTHGSVSLEGVLPFAPSYDTLGWMARDGLMLAGMGAALFGAEELPTPAPLELHWAADVAALADPEVAECIRHAARQLDLRGPLDALPDGPVPHQEAYTVLQGDEIRRTLGPWIAAHRPRFGANIARRFDSLAGIRPEQVQRCTAWRATQRLRMAALLGADRALVFPTSPCPALKLDAGEAERGRFYAVALAVNAIAGHAGLPQVTLPAGRVGGAPVGLSIVGPAGSDARLLALAARWTAMA